MLYIVNNSNDPYFNLSLEEYLLKELDVGDHYLMLWQNRPVVVVGRNQNTWDEVNLDYIKENDVAVVRRQTGGGAVYHDLGNLNFTFVFRDQRYGSYDFGYFMEPVVEVLKGLGLAAEIDGRNDITIEGKKVSGNSQYRQKDRVIHHGTLLFDVNLDNLEQALLVSPDKIAKRGVSSVKSRVTNIRSLLSSSLEIDNFKDVIKNALLEEFFQWRKALPTKEISIDFAPFNHPFLHIQEYVEPTPGKTPGSFNVIERGCPEVPFPVSYTL